MPFVPTTLTVSNWSTPVTITENDSIKNLDNAINDIVDTNVGSIKNHINTELGKVPAYLSENLQTLSDQFDVVMEGATTNATNAQLKAWEAQAEAMTAEAYATTPLNTFVVEYTSDGDGTFTEVATTKYSALHWALTVEEQIEVHFSRLNELSTTLNANNDFDTRTYTTGEKKVWGWTGSQLDTVKFYDTDGVTLIATKTYTYDANNIPHRIWS